MQIGGLALNSKQFSLALRSFQTANRLSAGSEQEDSTFGIAMCLAQDNIQLRETKSAWFVLSPFS